MKTRRTFEWLSCGWKAGCAVFLLCVATTVAAQAQTFKTLYSFDDTDGAAIPEAALVQGVDGSLYGTTAGMTDYCPPSSCGTVFRITTKGTLTTMHAFEGSDGSDPFGALIQATDGDFYGTTPWGGTCEGGTFFSITPAGTLTTLHAFCEPDGSQPYAGVVQASDGDFYGTALYGGADTFFGAVFRTAPNGALTTLYSFCSLADCTDGANPWAGLIQATDGNFYGTTSSGGNPIFGGTAFKVSPTGTLTTLYRFCSQSNCRDGFGPRAGLVLGTDGNFYGTTVAGGANGDGTVFRITPGGTLTTLYSFCSQSNCADGSSPYAGLIQATDGNFYGMTTLGGNSNSQVCDKGGCGTIFQITPAGALTTLYSFCSRRNCADGANPMMAGLVQHTDGNFYGTTAGGGSSTRCEGQPCGTVFGLSVGLGPFVKTLPAAGRTGTKVGILGDNLRGATGVSVNGTAASFTVKSDTLLITTVPTGATTGYVTVNTPTGTLTSNVPFYVIP